MVSSNCKSCKSKDITEKVIGDYYYHICNDCFVVSSTHKVKLGFLCCENSNMQYVLSKGRGSNVVKQCLSCGFKLEGSFKKSLLGDKPLSFNSELHNSYQTKQSSHVEDVIKLQSFYAYKKKCREKSEWFEEEYNHYLSSKIWRHKRERVLKRDKGKCRACGIGMATQVHHLSYRFVGNEPLYDLVSICTRCHKKITDMDETEVKRNYNIE